MVIGLHKVFKTYVKYISQDLPPWGESGSEVSYFIPEPRNVFEVTKFFRQHTETLSKVNLKGD